MKRIVSIVVVVVAVLVAAAYITDMPILRPVRTITDKMIEGIPQPPKSSENCNECEASCARQFEKCKETNCGSSGEADVSERCIQKCTDRYRACYIGCAGKYGKEKCPPPSVSNVF